MLKHVERAFYRLERILAGLVFNDVPARVAFSFTERKDGLPIDFVLAKNGLRSATVGFDMNTAYAAGILIEHGNRVSSPVTAVACIELENDLRFRIAEENV